MQTISKVVLNVDDFGAVGDYNPTTGSGTDDSSAIQAALNYAFNQGGGTVELSRKKYKLGAQITIPVSVTLRGPHSNVQSGFRGNVDYTGVLPGSIFAGLAPDTGRNFRDLVGAIWVCFDAGKGDGTATYNVATSYNFAGGSALPNYTSRTGAIKVGGTLEGCYLFQYAYQNAPGAPYTDSATWNAAWNSGTMASQAISVYGEEACVKNCFIGGFMGAILSYNESAPRFSDLLIDCMNGIEICACRDTAQVRNIHAFPFSALMGGVNGSVVRRGTFLFLHDEVDWGEYCNLFSYGHKYGFVIIAGTTGSQLTNIGCDNYGDPEIVGSYGLIVGANCQQTIVNNFRCANREYGAYIVCPSVSSVTLNGIGFSTVNTGVYVSSGDCFVAGGQIDTCSAGVGSGTRVGVNNASGGASTVKYLGKITNAVSNTLGVVTLL